VQPDAHDEPPRAPPRRARSKRRQRTIAIVTLVLLFAACVTFWPLVTPIVLAAWGAHLARPIYARLSRGLRGSTRAAALLTVILVVLLAAPVVLAVLTLVPATQTLIEQLRSAHGGKGALQALVSGGGSTGTSAGDLWGLVREYGARASSILLAAAGASAAGIVALFVFFATFFAFLTEGGAAFAWFEGRAPLDAPALRRLAGAFHQAGRGLLVGTGLTALAQGVLAGVIYAALGVPRAVLLGLLTVIGALIPMTGTAIVWLPVAAGLALTGHVVKAIILIVLGVFVVGTVDNVVRPWLADRANVGLPTMVVLVAIFGGLATFGAWGIVLGPLVVRLAVEALEIARERGAFGRRRAPS
jgi:predicted PurR-regulated permease PerM